MKGIMLLIILLPVIGAGYAQADTLSKEKRLLQLKEAQEKINREMLDLQQQVAKEKSQSGKTEIVYNSDRPMQLVTARILDKGTDRPAAGIRCYLSVPGDRFELRTALSDNDGTIRFLLQHVYAGKPMIFETDHRVDSLYRFEVGDPFSGKKMSRENANDSIAFFGKPDKRYMLDDYTRFPTLEEVLIEYVGEIKIRKLRSHYSLQVLNTPYKTFFEQEPIILLDGVPVFDTDALMAIDPLKIKKLEVMARRYYYGSMAWDGVVSFSSYDGDLAGYTLADNAVVKEFRK